MTTMVRGSMRRGSQDFIFFGLGFGGAGFLWGVDAAGLEAFNLYGLSLRRRVISWVGVRVVSRVYPVAGVHIRVIALPVGRPVVTDAAPVHLVHLTVGDDHSGVGEETIDPSRAD